jgi:hypothetical protein
LALKYALWKFAKATILGEWKKRMSQLEVLDLNAHDWLAKNPA